MLGTKVVQGLLGTEGTEIPSPNETRLSQNEIGARRKLRDDER